MDGMMVFGLWMVGYVVVIFFMWWVMMLGMMLLSVVFLLLFFVCMMCKEKEKGVFYVLIGVFVLGYVVMWVVFSVIVIGV